MHFLLTTLKVVYVLTTPMPELLEDATVEAIRIRAKWENDDYICRGHILNGMSDSLFDVYTNVESAKELWDSLESKYMAEDSSSKKFLVSNFNNYKMVDSRPVMEQYNELLRILGQYTQHGLKMDESISVSSIIDKLPPSWKDFKHTLKHGKDDLSLVQLGSHLRIEESLRAQDSDKGKGKEVAGPSVNMAEEGKNKNNKQNKGKKRDFKEHGSGLGSNKKPKLECWKYGKTGHFKRDYRSGNKKNVNVGGSGKGSKDHSQDEGFDYYNDGSYHELKLLIQPKEKVPNKRNKTTPYELWYKKRPNLSFLRVWGCRAVVRLPDPKRKTLGEKVEGSRDQVGSQYLQYYSIEEDPRTYNEAMQSRDSAFWKEAIDDEIGSIMENNTWVLSDLPPGCKPLGCKWIFKRKMKVDGTIDKFKARLVIQGFRQK
ncbi:zinc finger, CCHC-type containing protein [Tanacetum coccineum]